MNKRFIFGKGNIILFIIGVLIVTIAYLIMSTGDITISPIMLIIAYVIVFPLAILIGSIAIRPKKDMRTPEPPEPEQEQKLKK
jgi:Sec-independent protein secretion pathway component TatC